MHYLLIIPFIITALYSKDVDYSIIVDQPFNDALFSITQDYDRQLSAVGFSNNYKNNPVQPSYDDPFEYLKSVSDKYGKTINLLKVDANANITINKNLKLKNFNKAVSILKTPTNGYLIGGYTINGSIIVIKLDKDANQIFTKTFGTNNYNKLSNLVQLEDGGVLAVGSSATSRHFRDNLFENGLGLNDIYLTRLTKDGRKLWSKKFGTEYDDNGIDAVEADDGSIIVLSSAYKGNMKEITLTRISENGNKIWIKSYKSNKIMAPYKIIKLRDNNFLVSLTQTNNMDIKQIQLIKFDLQKNTLIDKLISTVYSSAIKDIKEYTNGNLIGVGHVKDSYNTDGLVVEFNDELNLLCQEHFGDKNYDSFNSVSIMHNNQAAVAGVTTSMTSQESNMWITKFNSDCKIAKMPKKLLNIHDELENLFEKELASKELILKEDLTIEFIDKSLYFKASEQELTKMQEKFLDKFSKKIIPFLYANKDIVKSIEINGHTSSEWASLNFRDKYLKNEKLSMNRAYSVLSYIFKKQDEKTQKWLTKVLKGSGLAYSKKALLYNAEDKEKSRRVSFKLILNSSN